MNSPALSDIAAATRDVVRKYRKQNQLTSLTPRLVRQEVEQALKLTEGTLDAKVYKDATKEATSKALADDKDDIDDHQLQNTAVKNKKRKSDLAEGGTKKVKRQSKTGEQSRPVYGKEKTEKRKDSKVYKSVEIIATSDDDDDEGEANAASSSNARPKTVVKAGPPKNRRKAMASSSDHELEPLPKLMAQSGRPDPDDNTAAKTGSSNPKRSINESGDKSESEMSVLIDAPVKKKAKKGRKAPEDAKKETKKKKSSSELSKHEETVKRLKSLVHACGVRKVWSKEFQNLDKPLQQVKRLKEILTELGMDGRPTMDKAKAIREKRDLAKELEDVRAFEQAVAGRPSRDRPRSSRDKQAVDLDSEDHDTSGSEHLQSGPSNHRNAARRSIMAFLGDDSDDEE